MERCYATVPFDVHRASLAPTLDKDSFRGMASVFGNLIDAFVPTRILPGAFANTIRENKNRIKVLFNHDADSPIGVPTRMEETRDGLLVEAKISQTEKGKEVLTLIRDGVLSELSIGFDPLKYSMVDEGALGQVRHISELRLWEFSPVVWAANNQAHITAVHARRRSDPRSVIDQVLDLELEALDADLALLDRRRGRVAADPWEVANRLIELDLDMLGRLR